MGPIMKKLLAIGLTASISIFGQSSFAASPTPTLIPSVSLLSPTNVGSYFKVESGFMASWSLPENLKGINGYTVIASNGAKCISNGASNNQCIFSNSVVPNPFKPFVPYTFVVVSNYTSGDSAPSAPSNPSAWNSAPGYPSPLLTKVVSDTQIDVEWVPSPSTGGLTNYGYRLTYWEVTLNAYGDPNNATRVDLLTSNTKASITGLKPSTWYVFGVAQCNTLGCSMSDWNYVATTPKVGAVLTWRPPLMINGGNASTSCWDAVLNGGTAAATGNFTKSVSKCGSTVIDPATYPKIDPTATVEQIPNLVNKFNQSIYLGGWQAKYSLATWAKIGLTWSPYLSLSSKSVLRGFLIPPVVTSNTPDICSVTGPTINMLKVGTCTISASAPGNSIWLPTKTTTSSFAIIA